MVTFLFVDIFDTAGTLYSVGRQAGYVDENDELHNSDEAFMSDATATIVGALCGTSTTTTYIESAAGIEEGGKTGLTAATVGVLMLSGLFFADIFASIPNTQWLAPLCGGCNDDEAGSRHRLVELDHGGASIPDHGDDALHLLDR